MEKFIPFEKLSKKKKQEENNKRRKTWGELSPITRRPPNPKAYDRNETKRNFQNELED